MTDNILEKQSPAKERHEKTAGVPYPVSSLESILEDAKKIIAEKGSAKPISKDEIASILKKQVGSLGLYFSTLVQYGVFNLMHGKGYVPSDLYRKYVQPTHDNSERVALLQMFKTPQLYSKIIENLNHHQLPSDERRFANQLQQEPYNVSALASDKAARIFFENARVLNLLDANNTFSLDDPNTTNMTQQNLAINKTVGGNVTMPIHFGNNRSGSIEYPTKLTKREIKIMVKALDFIANTAMEEDTEEIGITLTEKNKEQQ